MQDVDIKSPPLIFTVFVSTKLSMSQTHTKFTVRRLKLTESNFLGQFSPLGGEASLPPRLASRERVAEHFPTEIRGSYAWKLENQSHHRFLLRQLWACVATLIFLVCVECWFEPRWPATNISAFVYLLARGLFQRSGQSDVPNGRSVVPNSLCHIF